MPAGAGKFTSPLRHVVVQQPVSVVPWLAVQLPVHGRLRAARIGLAAPPTWCRCRCSFSRERDLVILTRL